MKHALTSADVIYTLKDFIVSDDRDEATCDIILAIGAELLDVSQDRMLELLCL